MSIYLLSGLPGTGKTTIQAELDKLGYDTIDTDKSWGYHGTIETEEPAVIPKDATNDWFVDHGWVWNSAVVKPILERPREKPLFVCGGSRNEEQFYKYFTKIFALHIDDKHMRERLEARNGAEGTTELFIKRMIAFNQKFYERAAKKGAIVIETNEPLEWCVQRILREIHAVA